MKTPGILYRISFLVVLNSLFVFAAVLFVSLENNQAKIDRAISYRFDCLAGYFRAELDEYNLAEPGDATGGEFNQQMLNAVFDRARKMLKGLGSLAIMEFSATDGQYVVRGASLYEPLEKYDPRIWERIAQDVDREKLREKGTYIGRRFDGKTGRYRTVYIPWAPPDVDVVLAVTLMPDQIVGSDAEYNWTIIVLFLVITLITLLIINFLFRKFVRPLNHLVQGMEKTAEGEVLYKIEDVTGDEMGRVAAAFNTMSSSLWDQRRRLTSTLGALSQANTSLAQSKSFLAKLIENAPFAVIATDPSGKILVFSRAASAMFDLPTDEALGRDVRGLFPFAPEKVLPDKEDPVSVCQEEMICRKQGGDSFPALVSRVVIRDDGAYINAFLFIIRDISESKGFQEMMISIDRMATRGVMAGEIAHEINNYLAIILGNVELVPLLLAKGKTDKVEKKLEILRATVGKIQRFSEGLMGYGNEAAVFRSGDLNQLIENLATFLKPQNRYDNITFQLDLSPHLPLVEFDDSQLQQLFVNLLNNAADALREKAGDRRVRIATARVDDNHVRVDIEDNAGGLPEDLPGVIFEQRYTGKRRGRGFGLVIVKRIIDKHCGTITWTSRPSQGTCFTMTFPVKMASFRPDVAAAARQVPS